MITRRERVPEGEPERRPSAPPKGDVFDLVPRRIAEREQGVHRPEAPSRASFREASAPGEPPGEERPLSVGEVVSRVRDFLEGAFHVAILVQGEVSNVRRPRGGHLYFTLKDRRAQLRVVVFARDLEALPHPVEDGAKVVVRGWITAYVDAGDLQLRADRVEPVGAGERAARTAALRKKLAAEGAFDASRKRPLPLLPRTIGLVTSPTGAAIRDVLSTIERRCPIVRVVLSPVRVSGEQAAPELALALRILDRAVECDAIIVARGGGSKEELLAFDEEAVVRAILECRAPVVCGIGHETDVSLADLAADVRAATPTAAAELAVPDLASLRAGLDEGAERLAASLRRRVELARRRLAACERSYGFRAPLEKAREGKRRLAELSARLDRAAASALQKSKGEVAAVAGKLDSLSPLKVLARGFSLTTRSGEVVRDAASLSPGDELETRLLSGKFTSRVVAVSPVLPERNGAEK